MKLATIALHAIICGVMLASVFTDPGVALAQFHRHLVTLDDLTTLRRAEDIQLSPKGDLLAYVTEGDIWLIATEPGSTPRRVGKGIVPAWSPDGSRLAYYSSASGTLQLWVREIETGYTECVTDLKDGIKPDPYTRLVGWTHDPLLYSWSPDSAKLVFASRMEIQQDKDVPVGREIAGVAEDLAKDKEKEKETSPLILTSSTPPEWTLAGIFTAGGFGVPNFLNGRIDWSAHATSPRPPTVNQLFIVDVHTKGVSQFTADNAVYFNPDWSPDGTTIVCASSEGRSLIGDGSGTTNIYALDLRTGKKTALTRGPGDKRLPSWSTDGRWVAYLASEHFGQQSVAVVPGTGGTPRNITSSLQRNVTDFRWGKSDDSIVIVYQDGVSWPIARIEVQTGISRPLVRKAMAVRLNPSVSRWETVAWQQSDGSGAGMIYILRAPDHVPIRLVDLNPQIKEWEIGLQEVIRWKNRRGEQKEGVLIKPVHYQLGKKYPLIVDAYPGQSNSFKGYEMTGNQAWASRGYAVFWPNARAPHDWINPFKSRAYDQAGKGPEGLRVMTDDVLSGVDHLIRRGIVDPERMGLYGFSNGAGIVNQLVTRTERFKCAVSVAAATSVDWSRAFFLSTLNPMIPRMAGVLPWQNPETYIRLSTIYHLDKIKTPMLLADGDDDGDFLLNMIEMYNGLRYLGRDVVFLRYPSQGHGFTGMAMKDFWDRESLFFDHHLKVNRPDQ